MKAWYDKSIKKNNLKITESKKKRKIKRGGRSDRWKIQVLTIGGWVCSLEINCRYLLILRDGSIRSWRSLNNRWYLLGNFSHDSLNLLTAPWPNPEIIANIELKFLHSLHWRATCNKIDQFRFKHQKMSCTLFFSIKLRNQ